MNGKTLETVWMCGVCGLSVILRTGAGSGQISLNADSLPETHKCNVGYAWTSDSGTPMPMPGASRRRTCLSTEL